MRTRFGRLNVSSLLFGGLLFIASFGPARAAEPAPASKKVAQVQRVVAKKHSPQMPAQTPSSRRQIASEYMQADNFGQACALLFQSCYYCCLGCGDLGLGLANAPIQPPETPVPAPVARAQAF